MRMLTTTAILLTAALALPGTPARAQTAAPVAGALHAGVVGRNGGPMTIIGEPGRHAYPATTRNGTRSNDFGPYDSSIRFETAAATTAARTNPSPPTPPRTAAPSTAASPPPTPGRTPASPS